MEDNTTFQLMEFPHTLQCGHSLSLSTIVLLDSKTCPLDRRGFSKNKLIYNRNLEQLIHSIEIPDRYKEAYTVDFPKNTILDSETFKLYHDCLELKKDIEESDSKSDSKRQSLIVLYTKLIKKCPFVLLLRYNRGIVYRELSSNAKSIADLTFCINRIDKKRPEYIQYSLEKAKILIKIGNQKFAKKILTELSTYTNLDSSHKDIIRKLLTRFSNV